MNRQTSEKAKKRLLIYAHYYIPDAASTGQIIRELAEGLLEAFDITVICVVPSYLGVIEDSYKTQKYYRENINGVKILRIRVPEFRKSDKKSRIGNILSYFLGAVSATFKVGKMDFVYAISQPPILGGLLGVFGKWIKGAKYIYNIQDFNPEQTMTVGYSKNKLVLSALMMLDKFSCRRADKIIIVGRDMAQTLKRRFGGKKIPKYCCINNWMNEKEVYPLNHDEILPFKNKYSLKHKFVFMYSGNIGLYYDLENLIKVMEKFPRGTRTGDGREVAFVFVGAGTILNDLKAYKEKRKMENVLFIPYQKKEELLYSLNAGDVHWCVNAKGMKGISCPSKFYGIAAAGKPVLGVLEDGTEVRSLIEEAGCGICSEPSDYDAVEQNIRWFIENAGTDKLIEMGDRGHQYLIDHLSRESSIKRYENEILSC